MTEEATFEQLMDRLEQATQGPMTSNQLQAVRATLAGVKEDLDNRAKRPYRRLSLVRRTEAANAPYSRMASHDNAAAPN